MAAVSGSNVSDTRLIAATGKTRGEWHALLDAENAATWPHPDIAKWLHREHGVDAWWAQGITVGYEQARGIRAPGQQADGTFVAGSSTTVDGELQSVLEKAITIFSDHLGSSPVSISRAAKHPTARWSLPDGTGVLVTVSPAAIGTVGRARVAATRTRLATEDALDGAKTELATVLQRFGE
ncbi:hypothetical protein FB562_0279 [Homoserinimonas aerilata]|uniref:DUF4287 domain-containing protein n=1 Tax=Homoserinimonas aerilata TaxID=1162970 RepID=A0A542YGM2_9MICO|nr:hypothetical protein [Homoserinimonas aerilata]TQL47227.1 hypothetical protein FB562_0279 [Homoserinimonas aerilata]